MIKDIITDENLGNVVEIVGMIRQCDFVSSEKNSGYLNVIIIDKSMRLDAKKWNATLIEKESIKVGSVYRIKGLLSLYREKKQLRIDSFEELVVGQYNDSDFNTCARTNLPDMKEELDKQIKKVNNPKIRKLLTTIFKENPDFFTYPAASSVHHAYKGGLLYHTLSVLRTALNIASNYTHETQINLDYVIAGCLLHDIGKTVEFTEAVNPSYSIEGTLVGHISIGLLMVNEVAKRVELEQEALMNINHAILSHHGALEFGSPVTPQTIEALIVHYADEIDSRMEILYEPLKQTQPGSMTEKISVLDRKSFYKPKE